MSNDGEKEDIDEIYNHEDLLIKKLATDYRQEFLDYLDLLYHENHKNPMELPSKIIKSKSATELITPNFRTLFMDCAYDMEDGSILHYEHFSGVLTEEKLVHAGRYIFEKREETKKDIVTLILSTGDPKKAARIVWFNKKTNFIPFRIIFLKEYSGDEKLKKIKDKVKHNKKLTFNEIIELVLMVLFDNSRSPAEVIEEVCYLTTKLVDATPKERNLLRWGLILVSNKFVKDPIKLKELRRVITMNNDSIYGLVHSAFQSEKEDYGEEKRQEGKIEGEIEGEIKGKKEGKIEGKEEKSIEIANNMLNKGYSLNEIVEITQININTLKQLKLGK